MKYLYITLLLTLFACSESADMLKPLKMAEAEDVEIFTNPLRIEVYFDADVSIISDYNQEIAIQVFNLSNDSLLDFHTQTIDRAVNSDGFLLWYVYKDKFELDTVDFYFKVFNFIDGITPRLTARTYYDRSDTVYFEGDQAFRVIIPKRGSGFNDPNFIEITKL